MAQLTAEVEAQRIEQVRFLAKIYGWQEIQFDLGSCMLGFRRKGVRLNVYYTKMTVSTALDHPLKGKTQIFRKHIGFGLLEAIFDNPRVHTNRGYAEKKYHNWRRWK